MDRRKSLKLIVTGAVASGAIAAGCNTDDKKATEAKPAEPAVGIDRSPEEMEYEKKLLAQGKFFTDHEMKTITVLADIIIPKDDVSGSASEAKVPDFIEFIVHDMPNHQTPMRGGLKWLDMQCFKRFNNSFIDCTNNQKMEMVDLIAYPDRVKDNKELKPGAGFFSLMRNLTATGFYTSEMGVKDVGYIGNQPTKWNGVPAEVLAQYKLAYTDKELKECI